jgi:ATP-dependent protease ClpP protease subunit
MDGKTLYVNWFGPVNEDRVRRLLELCIGQGANGRPDTVYVCMNTGGGSNAPAYHFFNVAPKLPCTLVFHNTGVIESAGAIVFVAGKRRYACKNSRFLLHPMGFNFKEVYVSLPDMREKLSVLERDAELQTGILANRTKFKPADLDKLWICGRSFGPEEAKKYGLIDEIRDWTLPKLATIINV